MKCPRCSSVLEETDYDGVAIEACPGCHGQWLFADELERIVEHHDEVFTAAEIASLEAVNQEIFTAEKDDHDELNCPACNNAPMQHFNYGDTSGIILHKCPNCDGIWMDKGELKKVEEVVDGWKADLNDDAVKFGSVLQKVDVEEQKDLDQAVSISHLGFVNRILRRFCE